MKPLHETAVDYADAEAGRRNAAVSSAGDDLYCRFRRLACHGRARCRHRHHFRRRRRPFLSRKIIAAVNNAESFPAASP